MSDLRPYREQVAELGKQANQAETDKQYEAAYNFYMQALDIFSYLIKCKCLAADRSSREKPAAHKDLQR